MIKNILIRRKESDAYLATVRVVMKVDKMCSFQPALWLSSADEGHSAG